MKIRFRETNPKMDDLIDSKDDTIELVGWSCDSGDVTIKDWKFINYKRPADKIHEYSHRVHLNDIIFENCTFKDVNFAGAVPIHGCIFENCTFENCMLTDHIRWSRFIKCTFTFCLFSGYFHDSVVEKSCKFKDVSLDYYTGEKEKTTMSGNIGCNKKKRMEILKYFYPNEISKIEKFVKGKPFFILATENDKARPKININGKSCYKDIFEKYNIELTHYEPKIWITGKHTHLLSECIVDQREEKLERILNEKKIWIYYWCRKLCNCWNTKRKT